MSAFDGLLACPACQGELRSGWSCARCGRQYEAQDGIPDLRLSMDARVEAVRRFYQQTPFPGYPAGATRVWLRARAERSDFARQLDRAIAPDARIVEIGCGTGQMSLYLARGSRVVVGADLSRESLRLAADAARRFEIERVQFVETDVLTPGLRSAAYDVVYASGVLHHTPDPRAAFARLVRLARPGGTVVVGVYNTFARIPLRLRRWVARVTRYRLIPFDPVLRDREREPGRHRAWLRDQYQHPEEHRHTVGEVQRWFAENAVEYLRTYPSALVGRAVDGDDDGPGLFTHAEDNWPFESWLAQLGWIGTLGHEGGLFVTIGRRGSHDG